MNCCGTLITQAHAEPNENQLACIGEAQDWMAIHEAGITVVEVSLVNGVITSVLTEKKTSVKTRVAKRRK